MTTLYSRSSKLVPRINNLCRHRVQCAAISNLLDSNALLSSSQTDCSQWKSPPPRSITAALRARDILTAFFWAICLSTAESDDRRWYFGTFPIPRFTPQTSSAFVICVSQVRLLSSYRFMSCSRLDGALENKKKCRGTFSDKRRSFERNAHYHPSAPVSFPLATLSAADHSVISLFRLAAGFRSMLLNTWSTKRRNAESTAWRSFQNLSFYRSPVMKVEPKNLAWYPKS